MSQLDGNSPNLGKYSIRKEEPSDDLRVGSFYRSHRSETSDKETKAQDAISTEKLERPNSDNVKPLVKESSSKLIDNDPKIQALEERFNTKKRPRHEANKQSDLRKISPSDHEKLETHLILDTTKASEDGDATHESVVVNLNPAILLDGVTDESSGQDYSKNTSLFENFVLYTPNLPKQMRKKKYPKRMPYDKIMLDVTFVLSGYENPRRSQLRDKALEMGATYKPNWCRTCTHLICAFKNTPKYKEVMADNGRIVSELWIQECSNQRRLLDWRKFKLGDYPYPDSEEECDVDDDLDYTLETSYTK